VQNTSIKIGSKAVGDGEPCFIVFEAGPTHDGIETAEELVRLAAEAGADAVKFQVIDPDRLVADREDLYTYTILVDRETGETGTVTEPQYDILKRRTLTRDEWLKLGRISGELGLAFFITVFWQDEIDLAVKMGCDSIKIASGDVNNLPLIRQAARSGLCIQLDTGSSTLEEVGAAVDVIREEGNERIIIHQCPSGYPARIESINLRIIPALKEKFGCPAAFSDHTPGWEMDVAAVAMGANLIEKTITLDRTTPSVEHIMSLEPDEMQAFVKTIREIEMAMGKSQRELSEAESIKRLQFRRSAYLVVPVKKGQKLSAAEVIFRRPGEGMGGDVYESLLDREFRDDFPAGHKLNESDLI